MDKTKRIVTPSTTPLKRYRLVCPECQDEDLLLPAGSPEEPYCKGCEDTIDLGRLKDFISDWLDYLNDREALLCQEEKCKSTE